MACWLRFDYYSSPYAYAPDGPSMAFVIILGCLILGILFTRHAGVYTIPRRRP
jgi:hypothetical protein